MKVKDDKRKVNVVVKAVSMNLFGGPDKTRRENGGDDEGGGRGDGGFVDDDC